MSVLINTLKAEHANILEMLESVYALGPTTEDGHNRLMAAKNGLMAHLKREDDELYPILLRQHRVILL
jgi:hemerythrin-like domain-containing protein